MISTQQIKYIRSLHQKKNRDKYNSFIAEGFKIVNEAIAVCPELLDQLVCTSKVKDQITINSLHSNTILSEADAKDFKKISAQSTPQEVLALIKKPLKQSPELLHYSDISIVLDRIRDPGNLGTLIRLADWFGVENIFCSSDTVDCYNTKVVQSSMGAIFRVGIHYLELNGFLKYIRRNPAIKIFGTSLKGNDLYKTKLSKPALIMFGNEADGISEKLVDYSDENLFIPNFSIYPNRSESLNVSVAAAIICAEFRRQTE